MRSQNLRGGLDSLGRKLAVIRKPCLKTLRIGQCQEIIERSSDEEDEEDKVSEEEQVRKGLGKRLDDGVVNQGVGASASGVGRMHHSAVDSQPSCGYSGIGPGGMYPVMQNVGDSSYSSIGEAVVGLFGLDVMSISIQADLAKKALNENLRRNLMDELWCHWQRMKKIYLPRCLMSLTWRILFLPPVRSSSLCKSFVTLFLFYVSFCRHSFLFDYGVTGSEIRNGRADSEADADADANLIPVLVENLAIPILHHQLSSCWATYSTVETNNAVSAMNLVIRYVDHSSLALGDLVPTWSPVEMNTVSNAARVAAHRFGTAVQLMRNMCSWDKFLSVHVLEKIALDELLCGKILPHLHIIHSNIHDAIFRTERVISSMNGVWAGPSVTGDWSRKLQALVDYLLLIGKTLEKKVGSGNMELETGKLVRRLK